MSKKIKIVNDEYSEHYDKSIIAIPIKDKYHSTIQLRIIPDSNSKFEFEKCGIDLFKFLSRGELETDLSCCCTFSFYDNYNFYSVTKKDCELIKKAIHTFTNKFILGCESLNIEKINGGWPGKDALAKWVHDLHYSDAILVSDTNIIPNSQYNNNYISLTDMFNSSPNIYAENRDFILYDAYIMTRGDYTEWDIIKLREFRDFLKGYKAYKINNEEYTCGICKVITDIVQQ